MAGTVLAPQQLSGRSLGQAPNYVAAAAQMELPNQAPTLLHIKTGATATNVTATNQTASPEGSANPNKVTALLANSEMMVRYDPGTYNMGNGNVQLAFSAVAAVTVAAYQLS